MTDCGAEVDEAETDAVLERVSDSWLVVELDVSIGAELEGGAEVVSAAVVELEEGSALDEAETDSVLEEMADSWLVADVEVSSGTELDGGAEVVSAAVVEL